MMAVMMFPEFYTTVIYRYIDICRALKRVKSTYRLRNLLVECVPNNSIQYYYNGSINIDFTLVSRINYYKKETYSK